MKILSQFFGDDGIREAKVCFVTDESYHHYKVFCITDEASHTKQFSREIDAEEYAESWILET